MWTCITSPSEKQVNNYVEVYCIVTDCDEVSTRKASLKKKDMEKTKQNKTNTAENEKGKSFMESAYFQGDPNFSRQYFSIEKWVTVM